MIGLALNARGTLVPGTPLERVHNNPWNPNRMKDHEYEALVASLRRHGQVAPLVVRFHPEEEGQFELVDGEHRKRACEEVGFSEVDIYNLGDIDDLTAMQLNAVLTESRGASDSFELGKLIQSMQGEGASLVQIAESLPHGVERLSQLVDAANYDWKTAVQDAPDPKPQAHEVFGPFRVPVAHAEAVRQALEEAQNRPGASTPELAFVAAVTNADLE